jgi:nitroimidazol reductase NimA-like FMN-containing flavoprotein (pyridoxamine 5'-phosphate oxidase superfamily)
MAILEMTEKDCHAFIARASMGRLGCCSLDNQPYVVPVCFAYEPDYLYVFSTFGKKIEWMRANPNVCMQIDEIETPSQWTSVIVDGRYQELTEPKNTAKRAHARELLEKQFQWWLNAFAERHMKSDKESSIKPLFFRVQIISMTGLRALAEDGRRASSEHFVIGPDLMRLLRNEKT